MPDTARCCDIAGLVSKAASPVVLRLPGCFGEQGEPPAVQPTWGCACSSRRSATHGPRSRPVCYLPASCPGLTAIPPPARAACRGVADSSLSCSWLCPGTKALCEFLPPRSESRIAEFPEKAIPPVVGEQGSSPVQIPLGDPLFLLGASQWHCCFCPCPPFLPVTPAGLCAAHSPALWSDLSPGWCVAPALWVFSTSCCPSSEAGKVPSSALGWRKQKARPLLCFSVAEKWPAVMAFTYQRAFQVTVNVFFANLPSLLLQLGWAKRRVGWSTSAEALQGAVHLCLCWQGRLLPLPPAPRQTSGSSGVSTRPFPSRTVSARRSAARAQPEPGGCRWSLLGTWPGVSDPGQWSEGTGLCEAAFSSQ